MESTRRSRGYLAAVLGGLIAAGLEAAAFLGIWASGLHGRSVVVALFPGIVSLGAWLGVGYRRQPRAVRTAAISFLMLFPFVGDWSLIHPGAWVATSFAAAGSFVVFARFVALVTDRLPRLAGPETRRARVVAAIIIGLWTAGMVTVALAWIAADRALEAAIGTPSAATMRVCPHPGRYSLLGGASVWSVAASRDGTTLAVGKCDYGLLGFSQALALRNQADSWTAVALQDLNGSEQLTGVSVTSASDAWAVGSAYTGTLETGLTEVPLILHWEGTRWTRVPAPNSASSVFRVSATSPTDAWAVGSNRTVGPSGAELDRTFVIEHWDGTAWSLSPAPDISGRLASLGDIDAVSANDVWATGGYMSDSGLDEPLVLHWDGSAWSNVPKAAPPVAARVTSVSASSSRDIWMVGSSRTENPRTWMTHWDGSRWHVVSLPTSIESSRVHSVFVSGLNEVWVVGSRDTAQFAARWDGKAWSTVPDLGPGILLDVLGVGDAVWAVGGTSYEGGSPVMVNLAKKTEVVARSAGS